MSIAVPDCGFKGMGSYSHKPWNERTVHFSNLHVLKHVHHGFFFSVRYNLRVFFLLLAFVVLVGGTLWVGMITLINAAFIGMFLLALILGLMVRSAKKEIIIEGLQVWLKDAYGILLPYEEAAIAYANFTNNKTQYELPNKGVMVRVKEGLIYKPVPAPDINPET